MNMLTYIIKTLTEQFKPTHPKKRETIYQVKKNKQLKVFQKM